jgi:2,3-bisphosphoglycerate-independent phosphoglycerate mutase
MIKMNQNRHKAFLIILDGWGIGSIRESNAIALAQTPEMDRLWSSYPHTTLVTHGVDVGLPVGQMGNSEVGHLNIGAGRVVYQELARINKYIEEGKLESDPILLDALNTAETKQGNIHIMGLVSDGGVHSHVDHLKALMGVVSNTFSGSVYLHAFMDGRDTDPKSGKGYLSDLLPLLEKTGVQLATIIGRYYAMDRDNRWERIQQAYDLLVKRKGEAIEDAVIALSEAYDKGITDEFLPPMVVSSTSFNGIKENELVIFFNFRTDRPRELVYALSQADVEGSDMCALPLDILTFTRYDETFRNVKVLFEKDDLSMTLGEVVAKAGRTQLRIAETEKYPHVTFFFSGGREQPFDGENRILVASPKVATYDLKPEMSAFKIRDEVLEQIESDGVDLIVLNFANADMVGHTGVLSAGIAAVEAVDQCLAKIVPTSLNNGYELLIIADHGNADLMVNPDGSPNTAHTTNPVPCIYVGEKNRHKRLKAGRLADVAPTLLYMLGIPIPPEMDGRILIEE